ncbi:MAG: MATE family efflux transporter [Spirochaetales bacterium]|nr:MATE family efflux transporter [Spirochaetales bacterium]
MKTGVDLLNDPVKSLIPRLSLPVMTAGLLRTSYSFVDMIFASRLGGLQVASVAFVGPLFQVIQALGFGLITGGVGLIARSIGEGDKEQASDYAYQLRSIVLVIALFISILGIFFINDVLKALGIGGDLLQQTALYTGILIYSIPFAMIIQLYMTFYKSQGKMAIITKLAFLGVVGNALLNALFVLLLNVGVQGLAYATFLTQVIQSVYIVVDYHRSEHDFYLSLKLTDRVLNFRAWKAIFRTGVPLSLSHGSTQFGFLLINALIAPYGYQVVAAFAIGNQINSIFYSPATGIGQAMIPLIAQNWGKKAVHRIRETIRYGMLFALVFGLAGAVCILMLREPLGMFLSKGDISILAHVKIYSGLMAWALIAWSIFQSLSGIFNGFQRTELTLGINLLRLWGLRIPGILLFRFFLPSLEAYGVWYTMFASNMIAVLGAVLLYLYCIPPYLRKKEVCSTSGNVLQENEI